MFKRLYTASKLVNAYNNMPPTFKQCEALNFTQIVPDYVSADVAQYRIDQVNKYETELKRLVK